MLFLLVAVFSLSIDIVIVEGGNTVYPKSEIANLTIAINKLLTQFTHKCPITEQSNSRDTINDLMQLVLTKQLLSVDSSSSCSPSQPNTCNNEGIQQAIEGLKETIDALNNSITVQAQRISEITDSIDSLTDAVSNITFPECPCEKQDHYLLFTSCEAIVRQWPYSPSGYYNIASNNGSVHQMYCHMESLCNSTGGWMRIANLNMTEGDSCPNGFRMYSEGGVHACGRPATSSGSCVGTIFSSSGIKYSQVCGKVIGYQVGWPDASGERASNIKSNINTYYVDGVSVTHGNPRKHVWTLMNGESDRSSRYSRCPCGNYGSSPAPSFVGLDYYCESGHKNRSLILGKLYPSDSLWDGKDCGSSETSCCQRPLIPWFYKSIGYYTTDYIEMRICCDEGTNDEDVPVEQYELYVK